MCIHLQQKICVYPCSSAVDLQAMADKSLRLKNIQIPLQFCSRKIQGMTLEGVIDAKYRKRQQKPG
jgi:hypothetical protein